MTQYLIRFPTDFFEDSWIESALKDMNYLYSNYSPQFPPTDILVDKKTGDLIYKLAVAGYSSDDLTITTEDGCIIVEANGSKYSTDDVEIVNRGIKDSQFKRRIPISNKYDLNLIDVQYSNGILNITIPIAEEKRPKQIKIK